MQSGYSKTRCTYDYSKVYSPLNAFHSALSKHLQLKSKSNIRPDALEKTKHQLT